MKVIIINGPNLNLLGVRERAVYGKKSFEEYLDDLRKKYSSVQIDYFQSNVEGEIINKLQEAGFSPRHKGRGRYDGIILNAGGYTHTSVAIADAIASIQTPVTEVHISNIYSREEFRHTSLIAGKCKGSISGFGLDSYRLAVEGLLKK